MRLQRGFTLIELVMVMIVVSVGTVGLVSLFSSTGNSLVINEAVLQASQYAQECAEKVVADRRNLGFSALSSTMCDALPTASGYTRTVSISADTSTACPSGSTCDDAVITVTSGTVTGGSSTLTVMLVN